MAHRGIVAFIALVAAYLHFRQKKEEKVSFETAKVEKRNIHTTITATGTIEPSHLGYCGYAGFRHSVEAVR